MTYSGFRLLEVANQTVFGASVDDRIIQEQKNILVSIERMRTEAHTEIKDEGERQTFLDCLDTRVVTCQEVIRLLEHQAGQDQTNRETVQGIIDHRAAQGW